MKKILNITILFLLLFSACKKEDSSLINAQLNTAFNLQFEEPANFDEGDFEFQVTKISDERCSCDMLCVWAGRVKLELEISHQGNKSIHEITTNNNVIGNEADLLKVVVGDYKIILTQVDPDICEVTSDEDYSFTFFISEN